MSQEVLKLGIPAGSLQKATIELFAKAGFNGAMALLCLIPGIGMIIVLCILAFGTWPAGQRN